MLPGGSWNAPFRNLAGGVRRKDERPKRNRREKEKSLEVELDRSGRFAREICFNPV